LETLREIRLWSPSLLILTTILVVASYYGIRKFRKWESRQQGKALEARFKKEREEREEAQRKKELAKRVSVFQEKRKRERQLTSADETRLPEREPSSVTS
jgi:hypothetical protein